MRRWGSPTRAAHLSFLCDAGFGLHLLGHWSRERGDIALPQAVESVTSRVADAYRIKDRGRLVPGACADLLLFDPDTVGRGDKVRVQDLPAGATRCIPRRWGCTGYGSTERGSSTRRVRSRALVLRVACCATSRIDHSSNN